MSKDTEQTNWRQRRNLLAATAAGLAGGSICLPLQPMKAAADEPSEFKRVGIYPGKAQAPQNVGYAPGNLAEGSHILFISGQGPSDLHADMETQMRQTFDRIGEILQDAGATFANVVILRAYFVHLQRDLPILRKVRLDYLGTPAPAATSVGVTELAVPGLEIEIEAVAVL